LAGTFNGLLTGEVLRFALLMAPFLVTGVLAGSWLQTRVNEARFVKLQDVSRVHRPQLIRNTTVTRSEGKV
jgi:hypothetical protein